jgi:transcriptional regulator with XRE-family HTH domain
MKSKDLETLSRRIREIRTSKKMTQEALSEKCGFDRTYISLLERSLRNPTYLSLLKLCEGLEIKLSDLFKDIE